MTQVLSHLQGELLEAERGFSTFEKITSLLTRHAAKFRVLAHEPEGQSDKIAKIRNNEPQQGAKAILTVSVASGDLRTYNLVVLPANAALDFGKLKKLVGVKNTTMAEPEALERITGDCVRGCVPPFSFWPEISLLVDRTLVEVNEEIVFNAGRLDRSVFLAVSDFQRIVRPRLVDLCK